MKAIGILWNSMNDYFDAAVSDIKKFAFVNDILSIDFKDYFFDFISRIYPYTGNELWKLEYKISNMYNQYGTNKIKILFLDIDPGDKKYIERKKKYIYENVENLKNFIREKYKKLIFNYAFDNIFHMTDDENEYIQTVKIVIDYIIFNFTINKQIIEMDSLFPNNCKKLDNSKRFGKRNKIMLCNDSLIYKEEKDETYESYSEVFCYKLLSKLEIPVAEYYLSKYMGKYGVTTKNFINNNEFFIDGTHIIDAYLTFLENNMIKYDKKVHHNIETITKYNNFDDLYIIFKIIESKTGINFYNVLSDLKRIYAIDLLFLQSDRNSNNWGILYNKDNKYVRLAPIYDNSNVFGFNNPDKIQKMKKSLESECEFYSILYVDNITLLNLHRNSNYFISKIKIIEDLDDDEVIYFLKKYIEIIENFGLENLIDEIILKMPKHNYDDFSKMLTKSLIINIKYIKERLKEKKKKFTK